MIKCLTCSQFSSDVRWGKDSIIYIKGVIAELLSTGRFVELGEISPKSPFLSVRYRCCECNAIWILTFPDQGMVGGLIREA